MVVVVEGDAVVAGNAVVVTVGMGRSGRSVGRSRRAIAFWYSSTDVLHQCSMLSLQGSNLVVLEDCSHDSTVALQQCT